MGKWLVSISDEKPLHMRHGGCCLLLSIFFVSISDEKPLHMRQVGCCMLSHHGVLFQSQTRSRSTCDYPWPLVSNTGLRVSISDEKPLHMRHIVVRHTVLLLPLFQSQTRSRSTCDIANSIGT